MLMLLPLCLFVCVFVFYLFVCVCVCVCVCSSSCREVFQVSQLPSTPYFINVDYSTARTINYWMDALSASFAAVQVL